MKPILVTLAIFFFGCTLVQAQSATPSKDSSSSKAADAATPQLQDVKPEPASGSSKVTLKDVGPSSPEEAARLTAKGLAEQTGAESSNRAGKKPAENNDQSKGKRAEDSKAPADDAVMEFRPAGPGPGNTATAGVASQAKQSKSAPKRVHGDLYGAKSGIGHADGGSVGATSKSGKTSIYVESDQTRTAAPQPR